MSGNIPVVTTTFEAGLQAKINAVNGLTPIEDIIALVRSGELITTIDNTPIQTELQLRMDAVDVNTETEKYIELAAAYGKITNTLAGGGGYWQVIDTVVDTYPISAGLLIESPTGSNGEKYSIELLNMGWSHSSTNNSAATLKIDGNNIHTGIFVSLNSSQTLAGSHAVWDTIYPIGNYVSGSVTTIPPTRGNTIFIQSNVNSLMYVRYSVSKWVEIV